MNRRSGLSVRWKLTLSYTGFLMLAGALVLGITWLFLLRFIPPLSLGGMLEGAFDPRLYVGGAGPRVFIPAAVLVMLFLLVFGLVGGWILAGRMLAPLDRVTRATRVAAAGSLSHRIALPGRRDEFRELADAFDAMLARLEAHVGEQQRFAANASHELRTPLAITRTLLDVARRDPDRDVDALLDRLQAVNTRAVDLTEALLLLGRAEQRSFTPEYVDLSLLVEEAIETFLPLAESRAISIETSGDDTTQVAGSRALLLQLVTNLVHNAVVHNLPHGGTVRVTTRTASGIAALTVENSGRELTRERLAVLAEPFQRGAERTRSDHAGAGLGLAIVRSITTAHNGRLALAPRPAGGLRVTIWLPARSSPAPGS
ncbi:HAMP domain-containing sensor histidine kinase [Myceligenerans crystallogenes]|uniref:histidine kinase n=1 Tax=Myceligenerans crystallogenes TaxID=316335 RepID=A0ABP4ZXT7_9MICO